MQDVDVNWIAVLVAGIVAMVIGAVWFSPRLFARPWMRAIGKTPEEIAASGSANLGYAVAALSSLVVAYLMSWVVDWAEAGNVFEGAATGFLVWLGFVATTFAVNTAFGGRPWMLYLIDAGHFLAVFVVVGAIVGAWQ
jgi:hypothetical protein